MAFRIIPNSVVRARETVPRATQPNGDLVGSSIATRVDDDSLSQQLFSGSCFSADQYRCLAGTDKHRVAPDHSCTHSISCVVADAHLP